MSSPENTQRVPESPILMFSKVDPLVKSEREIKQAEIYKAIVKMPELNTIPEAERLEEDEEFAKLVPDDNERFTVEKCFHKIGDDGKYQRSILYTAILSLIAGGMISFSVNFMAADPTFQCPVPKKPGQYIECPEGTACRTPGYKYYFKFDSWAKSDKLYCERRHIRNQGKVISFVVNAVTCLLLLNVSDILGRKFVVCMNSILIIVALTGAYFYKDYLVRMFLIGIAFGSEGDFIPLFIFLMAEATSSKAKLRSIISPAISMAFCSGFVLINILSFFFQDATTLIRSMIVCMCLLLFPAFIFLKESPVWLTHKGHISRAIEILKEINFINTKSTRLELYIIKLGERLEEIHKEKINSSRAVGGSYCDRLCTVFTSREILRPLIILSLITCSTYSILYAVFSQSQDLGFHTFQLNGIFFGINQILGFIAVMPVISTSPRRKSMLYIQSALIACAALLLILSYFKKDPIAQFFSGFISNFMISFIMAMYFSFMNLVNSESFSPEYKGICVGFILFCGKLFGSLSPVIAHWCRERHLHILVGCSVPLIPAMLGTYFLRETYIPGNAASMPDH